MKRYKIRKFLLSTAGVATLALGCTIINSANTSSISKILTPHEEKNNSLRLDGGSKIFVWWYVILINFLFIKIKSN